MHPPHATGYAQADDSNWYQATDSRVWDSELEPSRRLHLGLDWLREHQGADGGWHSSTYGQMRTGAGNTALIVYALSNLRTDSRENFGFIEIRRGLTFLLKSLDDSGYVRTGNGTTDYPTYATALSLMALQRLDERGWEVERARMVHYLVSAQQNESQGWSPEDSVYGAWAQTGGPDETRKKAAQVDLAVSCLVLEALQGEPNVDSKVFERARVFLSRCQNTLETNVDGKRNEIADGGFFFTNAENDLRNKAGEALLSSGLRRPRSYGTATVDGIRSLLACGLPSDHARVSQAAQWITRHPETIQVPGFIDEESQNVWATGLRFYYWAGLSQILSLLPEKDRVRRSKILQNELIKLQQTDGSWRNESPAMREDDPLIATAFAVLTLDRLVHHPTWN